MNFKWKSVFTALMIGCGICFTSCSESDDVIPPDEGNDSGEKGYFSFSLETNSDILTKAATTNDGEPGEATVKNGYLVFYDPATMLVKYQFPLSISTDGVIPFEGPDVAGPVTTGNTPANTTSKFTFTSAAKQLIKQDYKLLVILNATQAMVDATVNKGKYFKDFEEVKDEVVSNFGTRNNQKVMEYIPMTNASGLVDVKAAQFKESKKEAEEATFPDLPIVQVDRILAKIFFAQSDTMKVYPQNATFTNAHWQLDNTNKKTYWVRRMTNTAPVTASNGQATGLATNSAGPHENVVPLVLRQLVYAEDPNWDGYSVDRKNAESVSAARLLAENFNFVAPGSIPPGDLLHTLATTANFDYVLENTMAAAEQWEDVTTRILVQGNYVPAGFTNGESYYYYAGAAFKHEDLYRMFTNRSLWPTTPTGLRDAVTALQGQHGYDFNVDTVPGNSLADPNGKLHFYKNGINYYSVLIRHFDDDYSLGDMNFGRYGVVRNNMYKITLNSINGPGKPVIPDPEGPDDKKQSYISAYVQVLPWVVRTQNVDM